MMCSKREVAVESGYFLPPWPVGESLGLVCTRVVEILILDFVTIKQIAFRIFQNMIQCCDLGINFYQNVKYIYMH